MPLYDFRCANGHVFERMVSLADFKAVQICSCEAVCSRVISRPNIIVENVGYQCPITDKWIGSKREHAENLASHGCRVYEPGETDLARRNKASEEAAFDKAIEDTVERTIDGLDSAKKEKLANELLGGADLAVERI